MARVGTMIGGKILLTMMLALMAIGYQYARSPSFRWRCNNVVAEWRGGKSGSLCDHALSWGGEARREITGKVTRVSDGDTVWVTDAAGKHKVRLNRIDAPESEQPYGKESATHLKSLVGGKTVRVEYDNLDQYGRILGIIFLGDTDINLQMVKDGCAWHYKHFDNTPAYAEAEREARAAKRGLWASGTAINPYQWRKENKRR